MASILYNFMVTPKPWYASRQVWFNTLTIIVAIASAHGWTPNDQLATTVAEILMVLSPFVNLFLRFVTKRPIGSSSN